MYLKFVLQQLPRVFVTPTLPELQYVEQFHGLPAVERNRNLLN